ncbi:hypothetical protein QFC19_000591 [Naganishia cerealis]|uniref:Uncharacterized protein n=1 Tax=Naganishia cerealis TaxID=610337 RepID=A0ACC2WN39_9TREE|nr:hypothetical protein QFC19_000591 [Naganishia cerealis]
MPGGAGQQVSANLDATGMASGGRESPSSNPPPAGQQQLLNKLPSRSALGSTTDFQNTGPISPAAVSTSSTASSFVFPVRSVFANMQYQPNTRGNPPPSSSGQGATMSRVASNTSNLSHTKSRSPSLATSEGAAENIRAHADSISQMLETAHHAKLPQADLNQQTFLNVDQDADQLRRSNSDSSGTATEGIYSAPLQRDEIHMPTSYLTSKARRSSDASTTRRPSNPDARRPTNSPLHTESDAHAHGQIDPVHQQACAPGLQTTNRCTTNAAGDTTAYHFSDRPGVDRESSASRPMSKIDPPNAGSLESDNEKNGNSSTGLPKANKASEVEVTEVRLPIHQQHESAEPDVGPAIDRPVDMSDIVRLGDVGETSSSSKKDGSAVEKSQKDEDSRPAVNRHQSVDHQQSVRNFVTSQAQTVNMPDPNASTPFPRELEEEGGYMMSSRHRSSSAQTDVENDFGLDSPARAIDSDGDTDVTGNYRGTSQSESQSQVSTDMADEPVMTVRFEHVTTEDGHHVVVGREGKLEKCEDEPITTPGAIQGFGVLMVLDEDEETGDLSVRQVSENSTELLGLSPRYLFRLQCFTHILPKSQDDALRDNIDYLANPDIDSAEMPDEGPQVFLLSGYGEPGSDDTDEIPTSRTINRRREWTCWVAAHRPSQKLWDKKDARGHPVPPPNFIVLEFELERDVYNPLYPPLTVPEYESGISSPASGSASGTTGSIATMGTGSFGNASGGETSRASKSTIASTETDATPGARGENHSNGTVPTIQTLSIGDSSSQRKHIRNRLMGLEGQDMAVDPANILESTTSHARPLRALERMRRMTRNAITDGDNMSDQENMHANGGTRRRARRKGPGSGGVGTMDVFAVLAQINDQLGAAPDLETFLKVVVGVIKDLTQFHRCLVYSFDAHWNGQVVAELVDWSKTHDLYKGLMFPMTDIPAQARELYRTNKVRLLYDRAQTTARLVLRSKEDLDHPLDMTHSYLRAMSPIHLVYLRNMGVRSSMSISIMAFGSLWGLIACHGYGDAGMRVSFPVRQMLKLLSDSISRNIERLSYAARLHTRKLISTIPTDSHPTGYIVSNADDLIHLFDADSGVLVIGDGAKILGPRTEQSQEILYIAEFLRLKRYEQMQISHNISEDFPELNNPKNLEVISGLLYVPLSAGGNDFIAFLRKGQLREVHWAGKPYKEGKEEGASLEPRQSFKMSLIKAWSETIKGRSRAWTDEQLETAGVLALVYGKFIEVWRQKEVAMRTNQLTSILLNNASHEVRTPLNHIINYLELALDGQLDTETRENLSRSHMASKSLLFTINDLLDLTRIESGNETAFNDPFDVRQCIKDATRIYESEAKRRNLDFTVDLSAAPECLVLGDHKKVRTVVANLVANAVKYTSQGKIRIDCRTRTESESGRSAPLAENMVDVEITADTEPTQPTGLGLGLAVVARIVEQLGGQLRAESEMDVGTRFFFSLLMARFDSATSTTGTSTTSRSFHTSPVDLEPARRSGSDSAISVTSQGSRSSEIDTFVQAFGSSHMQKHKDSSPDPRVQSAEARMNQPGTFPVTDSSWPIKPAKPDLDTVEKPPPPPDPAFGGGSSQRHNTLTLIQAGQSSPGGTAGVKHQPIPLEEVHVEDKAYEGHASSNDIAPTKVTSSTKRGSLEKSSPNATGKSKSKNKLRILVVEDDDVNRRILERRLKLDGHSVLSEINGQDAVDRIKRDQAFDCILMDIQMPVMDGKQAASAIRKYEELLEAGAAPAACRVDNRIPIIAVSATLLENQSTELGVDFDGWMLKPIDFKRMLHILSGISQPELRAHDGYRRGQWERGGWLNAQLLDYVLSMAAEHAIIL